MKTTIRYKPLTNNSKINSYVKISTIFCIFYESEQKDGVTITKRVILQNKTPEIIWKQWEEMHGTICTWPACELTMVLYLNLNFNYDGV